MEKFDQAYYQRYYQDPNTRAVSPREQTEQVHFIASYLRYLQIDVTSGVDVGCGVGNMLNAFKHEYPDAEWHGVEVSDYLCETYGWTQGSVVDININPVDLVICSDVLGYLDKQECRRALRNLTRMTNHALYISVLTAEDLDICDQDITDMSQKVRPSSWYKNLLMKSFQNIGGGLFLKRPLTSAVWHMERL